ncbi:MAG: YceH family protein [Gemmatimonadota bacterium]
MSPLPALSLLETRVLGVLVEKEKTVPDTYPLSLNALTSGCNQKNNRDPVMNASDAEVQQAIDHLKTLSLVIESSGARVTRYSHNVGRVLKVPDQSVALLTVLMLRGPQTAGEMRINAERLHRFADISSVEAFLEELATRPDANGGALVAKLARQPGEREQRWVHLLAGNSYALAPDEPAPPSAANADAEIAALRAEVAQLAAEVAQLRALVERLQGSAG